MFIINITKHYPESLLHYALKGCASNSPLHYIKTCFPPTPSTYKSNKHFGDTKREWLLKRTTRDLKVCGDCHDLNRIQRKR